MMPLFSSNCLHWKSTIILFFCLITISTSLPSPTSTENALEIGRDSRKIESSPGTEDSQVHVDLVNIVYEGDTVTEPVEIQGQGHEKVKEEELDDPHAPERLRLKTTHDEASHIVSLNWDRPQFIKGSLTGYKVTLEEFPLSDGVVNAAFDHTNYPLHQDQLKVGDPFTRSFLLDGTLTHFTTSDKVYPLSPGRSYGVRVQSLFQSRSSSPISANFTLRPNPPDRFVVWYRNETCFLVLWQPPTSGFFATYKAELTPSESSSSTLFVTPWEYQFGGVRPGFCGLTPGKAYNISVATVSELESEGQAGVESAPLVIEYRTMPLPVSGVTISVLHFKETASTKFLVEWEPPSQTLGEYDGFNVYIKVSEWGKPVQKFVPRSKPPRVHLDDDGLVPGSSYEVVVKTVSGKVSSHSVLKAFTYLLPPDVDSPLSLPVQDSQPDFHLQAVEPSTFTEPVV